MSDNVLLHLGEEPRSTKSKPKISNRPANRHAEAREQIAAIKAQTHTDWANTVEKLTDITDASAAFGAWFPISTPWSIRPSCVPYTTN